MPLKSKNAAMAPRAIFVLLLLRYFPLSISAASSSSADTAGADSASGSGFPEARESARWRYEGREERAGEERRGLLSSFEGLWDPGKLEY